MLKRRDITGRLTKAVLTTVLSLCVIFSAAPVKINANSPIVADPTKNREGYAAYLYDNTTGLPTSEANAIAETSDGFIWIGSYGGLIRYDGNSFERYDSTSGIASVVSLFVDSRDRLWIGTNDNGAAVMDKYGNVTMYGKKDGLPSASIRSFAEGSSGIIYIGTTQGVSYVTGDGKLVAVDESLINNKYIRQIETGSDGITYGLTTEDDIFTLKDGSLVEFHNGASLGIDGTLRALSTDPDHHGYLYIGSNKDTGSKVWYGSLDPAVGFKTSERINVAPLDYINSIKCNGKDLWVCTNRGAGNYRDENMHVLENVPMTTNVEQMMSDYQGNLWFVSSRQGVMKVVPNQFANVFDKYKLPEEVVNTTCYYKDKLFIGKDSGLTVLNKDGKVGRIDLKLATTAAGEHLGYLDLVSMLGNARIRSIYKDSKDRLWFATYGDLGLVRFDGENVMTFTHEDGLPDSRRIRTVVERSDGSFLVACTGGVAVIRDDKVEHLYDSSAGLSNTEILTVSEGFNGEILAGTDGDGIYIIGSSGVKHLSTENGLMSDVVMRIKKSSVNDVYWIVTSNSIAYMTADHVIHTIKNFPYSNNFDLYENSKGDVWVLSSNGIYVVNEATLIANEAIDPVFYGIANGLPVITTSNSYSSVTPEGDLYIAGSTGVVKVNIERSFESVNNIKMIVPYVEADGVKIYADEHGKIVVPHEVKKITVYPFICTYTLMNPKVTYRLEGFGSYESTVRRNELSTVDYTNLKGGTYTFHMKLSDAMGIGDKEYSIVIVKQKAIYEHYWFMICVAVLILGVIALLVFIYVNAKTKKLLKKQEEDKLLIREIVEAFAKTIDMKDKYTNGHSKRVAEYTSMLARELGYDEETVEKYYNIALLHDIGKIGVPAEVLNKPGKLDDNEFQTIKSHTVLGYNVLRDIHIMPELSVGAESHHERPDGKGYPQGLKGDEIPRVAQIIGVADAFDAMYSNRPYRKRMNFEKVVSIIKDASGTQLTADVVDAFLRIVERGGFRAPDDVGGGTTEDIDNIHKRFEKEEKDKEKASENKTEEKTEEKSEDKENTNGDNKEQK